MFDPCRTSESDRMEAMYVLGALAIILAWLLISGCAGHSAAKPVIAGTPVVAATSEPAPVMADANTEPMPEARSEAATNTSDEPVVVREVIVLRGATTCNDAGRELERLQRQTWRDVDRLSREVQRHSTTHRHHH